MDRDRRRVLAGGGILLVCKEEGGLCNELHGTVYRGMVQATREVFQLDLCWGVHLFGLLWGFLGFGRIPGY